jgi:DNA-binding NarL/FixJ family response regulator
LPRHQLGLLPQSTSTDPDPSNPDETRRVDEVASSAADRRWPGDATQAITDRERDVLGLMAEGHFNQGVCNKLFLGPKTVQAHVSQLFLLLTPLLIVDACSYKLSRHRA